MPTMIRSSVSVLELSLNMPGRANQSAESVEYEQSRWCWAQVEASIEAHGASLALCLAEIYIGNLCNGDEL